MIGLVDGDDVEVDEAAGQFERIIGRTGQLAGLKQAVRQFLRKEEEERRYPLNELREILAREALHA